MRQSTEKNTCFTQKHKDWQWVIGASVDTAPLYQAIENRKRTAKQCTQLYYKALFLLLGTIGFIIVFTVFF